MSSSSLEEELSFFLTLDGIRREVKISPPISAEDLATAIKAVFQIKPLGVELGKLNYIDIILFIFKNKKLKQKLFPFLF